MADLAALKARAEALEGDARKARAEYNAAVIEASGLKVDDVIEVRFFSNEDWQPAIVRKLYVRYGKVNVDVSVKTKAGWSKAVREARTYRTNGEERHTW